MFQEGPAWTEVPSMRSFGITESHSGESGGGRAQTETD